MATCKRCQLCSCKCKCPKLTVSNGGQPRYKEIVKQNGVVVGYSVIHPDDAA